jgi:predicted KAP-like P-loop ATPase
MLAIRAAVARAHGVMVEQGTLTKMLLLERCAPPKIYSDIAAEVMRSADGRAAMLEAGEAAARKAGDDPLPAPWNEPFLQDWLRLSPELGPLDLRGVLYVSREHAPLMSPEDRLSPEAAELLAGLLETPGQAGTVAKKLPQRTAPERATIMRNLLARARREQKWGAPDILIACMAIADVDAAQAQILAAFLLDIPAAQLEASIVPRLSGKPWAKKVFVEWQGNGDVSKTVKNAIAQLKA